MFLLSRHLLGLRRCAWSCGLAISIWPSVLKADSISLQTAVDSGGLTTVTVPNSDDSEWLFQWFIDGKALSDTPLAHANQLVVYPDQPQPGTNCQVMIYEGTTVVPSVTMNLLTGLSIAGDSSAAVDGASASTSAPSTSSSLTSSSSSSGAPGTTDVSGSTSTSADLSPITTSGVPTGSSALVNLSTRGFVKQGAPLIAGLIVSGTDSKPVLIRGLGPALTQYGVNGALKNPVLTLYSGSTAIASNDDWSAGDAGVAAASQAVNVTPLTAGSQDSALFVVLKPGGYTVQLSGASGASGIGLVEFYDAAASNTAQSKLINISSRGYVGTGSEVMIVGFIVGGDLPKKVLIRGLGPALLNYNVTNAMPDPKVTLYSGSTVIASNDDWAVGQDASIVTSAVQQTGASPLAAGSLDAALVVTLAPGGYTAIVGTGATNSSTGEALVEVYEVEGD